MKIKYRQRDKNLLRGILDIAEPLILLVMIVAFWHHSPPIRDNWVGLLWLALPIFALRLLVYRRLFTLTPLLPLLLIFIPLTLFNFQFAPYHRADYFVLVCRPLLGIWLYLYCVEHARVFRRMDALWIATIGMAGVAGILSLTASQWNEKIAALQFLVDALPRIAYKNYLPDMLLSFNPNEIAGALAWLCPILAGLRVYFTKDLGVESAAFFAAIAFILCAAGLFFGQSRFAIAGVLLELLMIVLLCMRGRGRLLALSGIVAVTVLQLALMANIIRAPENTTTATLALSGRDQESLSVRFEIWASSIRMMTDNPLTGVGMSMFRTAVQQPRYAIPFYIERNSYPPHAHNEWLQIGADLGIAGFILFGSWHLATGWMLWRVWRKGSSAAKLLAVTVAGGILAHAFYGMGDAVTLWDRYQFLFWWLLGLAGALWTQQKYSHT